MKDYATYILDFNPENIKTGRVPGEDKKTTAWFFVANQKELRKTIFDLFVFSDDIRKVEFTKKQEGETSTTTNEKDGKSSGGNSTPPEKETSKAKTPAKRQR